jgi:hypothetical protein
MHTLYFLIYLQDLLMKKGLIAILLFFTFHLPLFTQNVGINTTTPLSTLDVKGSLSIGSSYGGTIAAPTNGAIIQGSVGIGISSPSTLLHIAEGNILATGTFGSSTSLEVSGIGTRLFFYPRKAAFRAGYVTGTNWDDANIGNYSLAMGYNPIASGNQSMALGTQVSATNGNATAIGTNTTASAGASTAIGYNANASATQSMSFGNYTTASGTQAMALGIGTTAASYTETAIGTYNTTYTPLNSGSWNTADRLLTIGNGASSAAKSDALVVLKSGNIGIGTSSPTNKLEVSGTTKTTNFQMTNGASNNYILKTDDNGNASWVNPSTLSLATDNLGNHTATQNINLGSNYLSNDGTSKGVQVGSLGEVTINGTSADLLNIGNSTNVQSVLAFKTTTQNWEVGTGNGFGTAFTITDVTNDEEPFVINANSDGRLLTLNGSNVGIGTSSPSYKLHVVGNTNIEAGRLTFTHTGESVFIGHDAGTNDDLSDNQNVYVGEGAGSQNVTGTLNTFVGSNAGLLTTSSRNVAVGQAAMEANTTGSFNTALGRFALGQNTTGGNNVAVGESAGENATGSSNTFIGQASGLNATGSNSVFIGVNAGANETQSNKLYIANSDTGTPLIYGDFDDNKVIINENLETKNLKITNGATNGYILQSDASGNATWINPTTLSTGSSQWTTSGSNIYKNNTANVGIGVTSPTELLHVSEGNFINSGTFNTSATLTVNGAGTRSFFYPRKAAFRAGTTTGTQFDHANIGNYSFGTGYNAQATAAYSNSLGFNNVASGSYATAIGNGSMASGTGALAIGLATTASGIWATAFGSNTTASGAYASANNVNTTAKAYAETVFGQYNTTYTPLSTTTWNTADRLFTIGNGTAAASTSDALTVLKSGNVGIGTSVPSNKLEISGTTSTTNLKLTSGATNGYVLQSDASGNGTWVAPTSLTAATQTAMKDADANTKIEVEQSSNDDKVHFTLGGKEYFTMNKGTLEFNNTGAAIYIGNAAGLTDTYTANTYNIGIGANALQKATSVADLSNTAIGIKAIQNLTTGSGNVAIGNDAMRYGNGDFNTAVGNYAGNAINSAGSGSQNVSIGNSAGAVVSGSNNTFLGTGAGANTTAGSNNVYLGLGTGENVYTGGSNVFIGYQAGASAGSAASNKLYIENSNSTSPLIYGDFTNDYVNINGKLGVGTATPSNYLDIQASGSATASVQSSTSTAYLKVVSPSANEAAYNFSTYSSGSALSRWQFGKSSTSESGSDAGSDFFINRYSDAGVYNGQPLSISRANGTVTVGNAGASATANTLKVNGSVSVPTTVQTGSFTLDGNDYCAIFTGSSGTFTLPTASTCSGRIYLIVNQGTVALTTSTYRTGSATTVTSVAIGASVQVISDGSEWRKIN